MMIGWACSGHMGLADDLRALSHFDESLAIARAADLQWHLGPTLIGRAYARAELGRYGEAWSDLAEALPRLQTLGLVRYQLMTHDAMGSMLLELAQPQAALRHFESGLQLAAGAGIRYWVPRLQANLALAQLAAGLAPDRARLREASERTQRHHEIWQLLRCLQAEAEIALAEGDGTGCSASAQGLLALAVAGGMRQVQANAHRLRGLGQLLGGDLDAARHDMEQGLTLAEQIGNPRLTWDCQQALALAASSCGDLQQLETRRNEAVEIAARIETSLDGSGLVCGLTALGQSAG
jgi:tetratricopeptide (TPR) repeat protein